MDGRHAQFHHACTNERNRRSTIKYDRGEARRGESGVREERIKEIKGKEMRIGRLVGR